MSEKHKFVTVNGQEYRIGKFSARQGAFVLTKVAGILAPMFAPLLKDGKAEQLMNMKAEEFKLDDLDLGAMFAPLSQVSEEDFMYLQGRSLAVCQVAKKSGYVPVMYENGSFSVEELEEDAMAVMALMIHALTHNLLGFFSENPLTNLSGVLGNTQNTNSQS